MTRCLPTTAGLAGLMAIVALAAAGQGAPATIPNPKAATAGSRLLLPLYLVDTSVPDGAVTIFTVRNELDVPAEIEIRYFRTDSPQAPQRTDPVTLAGKQVWPVNVRMVDDLQVDENGIARGYVVIEALTEGAVIQGDYYRVDPTEDFATGFRLLNIDAASSDNDLCGLFTLRFLNGGGFDSGTTFLVWIDLDLAPAGEVFALAAYDEAGNLLQTRTFAADEVAFEVSAEELLHPFVQGFGAIEFQLSDGAVGHVSATVSAEGRYSVGLEAACRDR